MNSSLNTILITGCSTGIGYETAKFLQLKGFRVITSARKTEDIARLTQEGFEAVQLDLADSASIQQAVTELLKLTEGKLDVLFNNAAFGQFGAVEDLSREVLREQFEANLFGTHELTNLIIPIMRKQGYGRIIYTSSLLGFVAMKYRGAYNSSKFALEGLVDTLRLELKGSNIYVSLIEPGPISSSFRKNAFDSYQHNIALSNSVHQQHYASVEHRLKEQGKPTLFASFTLPAQAVAEKVLIAINANKPKPRYYVTFPAHFFAVLKRILPITWLDFILEKMN
jgi:short-subunit dehydrogenase